MQLNAEVKIAHLNIRRERQGEEDGPVAADVKITAVISIDALRNLFATETGFAQLAAFWQGNGELQTGEWAGFQMAREGSGLKVDFQTLIAESSLQFADAELNKIRIVPKPGRVVDFSARIQLKPAEEQIGRLAELLGDSVTVFVEQPQLGLALEEKKTPMERAGDAAQEALDLTRKRTAAEFPTSASEEGTTVVSIADQDDATLAPLEEAAPPQSQHPCQLGEHTWSDDDGENPVICVHCDVLKPADNEEPGSVH